jgi:hypothetical protein
MRPRPAARPQIVARRVISCPAARTRCAQTRKILSTARTARPTAGEIVIHSRTPIARQRKPRLRPPEKLEKAARLPKTSHRHKCFRIND